MIRTSVFKIKSENSNVTQSQENTSEGLSKSDVLDSIPSNATNSENPILAKTMIEWRWRIFKIPSKSNDVIEISKKEPDKQREYINKDGEWVNRNIDPYFDRFVVQKYYAYFEE